MASSALRYSGAAGRSVRSPLLKLQSDERLVNLVRRGNQGAFEVLVGRYHARLLSFCRHMLGSREDAEDVLQDVLTASYNAMLADDRPINVRPWLYRIARNRCLNHLRRNKPVGVDSMDVHLAEHGATTADKVHEREEFRQLLHDIRDLPETQRTALVLREMDALSYEQIAEAMETTVSSVKSLLVRARVSLTEAAEARLLSCDEVREELAEIAEGMRRKQSAPARRHVKNCSRCQLFSGEMKKSSRALAALTPIGPLALLQKLLFAHAASHSAGSAGIAGAAGAGGAGGAGAAGAGAAGAAGAAGGAGSAGLVTAGVGAVATKAAAGIAAAALVTAGTVAIDHSAPHKRTGPSNSVLVHRSLSSGLADALASSSLAAPVGSGPGLNAAVVATRAAKPIHATIVNSAITARTTVGQAGHVTQRATTGTGTANKVDATVQAPPTETLSPPATSVQGSPVTTTAAANVSPTGGAGLGTAGASTATTPPTSAGTTSTATSSTASDTTATGSTSTGSTTTPTSTQTTTATSTSPAGTTTTPTGTTTAPTGTTTAPAGTTTAPADTTTTGSTGTTTSSSSSTATTPDTTTGASTTPTPPASGS